MTKEKCGHLYGAACFKLEFWEVMEDETKKDSDENVPWLPGNEPKKNLSELLKTKRMKSLWILPGKNPEEEHTSAKMFPV